MQNSTIGQVNVLFTSVGRRVELLRAFRAAYRKLGIGGNIVALDIDPIAPALREADRPYIAPRVNSADYIPTVVEICRREQVGMVFPLIDPDIPVLANHRAEIEQAGARVAVVSPRMAAMTADKWETVKFFAGLGLAAPRSWLPEDFGSIPRDYPLFIKPRGGSAAQNTFKVRNERELAFFIEYVPDPIVQEYLPGPEITNDVIVGLDGEVLDVISRRRIEVRWGEVAKGVTVYDPAVTRACIGIAEAMRAVGPITVQCMMKDGTPHFTEINARLGGGVPLGVAAGSDSPAWLLAKAAGLPIDIPPPGSYRQGLYITRFDDSFFLSEDERGKMAGNRL